ncbi:glycosyltransferase [Clostridium perfringens]|nr:glycosyltransferase [Clostridium perfringens]
MSRFFWYQIVLPKFIKNNNYDYMINMTNYGPIFPGCKQILLLHNPKHVSQEIKNSFNKKNKIKLKFQDFILKLSLIGADNLVVQTNYMKEGVIKKFNFPKEKIYVIPNSPPTIKRDNIDKTLEKQILDFIGDEQNVLSNITLYSKHKNLETLFEAINYIKENRLCKLKLIITIDESENEDAKSLISLIDKYELQEYILSVGNIKHENIHQILSKSKVFVFPSYAETLGIPFIEAMKFNLPIIASDLGFAHDVCGDSAIYFEYNNVKDLAFKINNLLSDNNMIEKLKVKSKEREKLYSEDLTVKSYLNLLNKN